LASGELELSSAEGLHGVWAGSVLASDGDDRLTDLDTGDKTLWFTVCTSHTSLESISSGTRQHLVDTHNMEGVASDSHVESILTAELGHVLVSTDTSGFESF